MLWFTLWFTVILKIPALYVVYLIWWSVKDPPAPGDGPAAGEPGGDPGGRGPWRRSARRPAPGRRPGPHGVPTRRPATTLARPRTHARA